MKSTVTRWSLAFAFCFMAAAPCPGQVTIFFDGSGAESGVTRRGVRNFSFMGSNWSGGVVDTEGILALYASGSFSYEIEAGGGSVTFDTGADSVRFFYVHGFGFAPGTATAFDASNTVIGMVNSRAATFFGDQNNFVTIDAVAPISRIEFSAGVIDNFSFTATSPPTVTPESTPTPTSPPVPTSTPVPTLAPVACVGDCNDDGQVTVDELLLGVELALTAASSEQCRAFDVNDDDRVGIEELVAAARAMVRTCT
jgi:hypothetical protein